jgi:hypothetical protein
MAALPPAFVHVILTGTPVGTSKAADSVVWAIQTLVRGATGEVTILG